MSEGIELTNLKQRRSTPTPPPRHPDAAAGGLGKAYRLAEEKAKAAVYLQEGGMDSIAFWGCGAALWFAALATPLLLFPRLLLFFSQIAPLNNLTSSQAAAMERDRDHYDVLTPLESFLCRVVGAGLVSMALVILFGLVPRYEGSADSSPPSSSMARAMPSAHANPARKPILGVLVGLSTIMSVVAYNTSTIGALGKVTGAGNAAVALWGWWVIVFGNTRLEERESKVPKRLRKL